MQNNVRGRNIVDDALVNTRADIPWSNPIPDVELACGSASISNTFLSRAPRLAAKLIAVVVLPTPPF